MNINKTELILALVAIISLGFVVFHMVVLSPTVPSESVGQNPDPATPTTPNEDPQPNDSVEPPSAPSDDLVACTLDAKECPDGSYVGRTGPDCEFAACPTEEPAQTTFTCTEEMKQAEACIEIYAPVCGLVDVQCITTPCDPIPETFSNSCFACAQGNVSSYTEGACEIN